MDADSKSDAEGVGDQFPDKPFELCTRVRDIREELGRRIRRMPAKSLTIVDRMRLAYYQNVLRLYESLSPDTMVHSGYGMSGHCSDHQEEVSEINKILHYILPEGDTTTRGVARLGSMSNALRSKGELGNCKAKSVTFSRSDFNLIQNGQLTQNKQPLRGCFVSGCGLALGAFWVNKKAAEVSRPRVK